MKRHHVALLSFGLLLFLLGAAGIALQIYAVLIKVLLMLLSALHCGGMR